jgi:uncharacterized protein YjdB
MKKIACFALTFYASILFFCAKAQTIQTITTVAGMYTGGYSGDGGPATAAHFLASYYCLVDVSGNLFISDANNNRIRKVNTAGIVTTYAGNGTGGYLGDGGPAIAAEIYTTGWGSIALDAAGNLYISEFLNNRIRKVSISGIITTIAGNGTSGYSGDGGAATSAMINHPTGGIAVDASNNIYFGDQGGYLVRKVNSSGIISTVAGSPTVAGCSGDGGPATAALFTSINDIAIDGAGSLLVADGSCGPCIRKINTSGIISKIAGNGTMGWTGDGGPVTAAALYAPMGLRVDVSGNIYVTGAHAVRKINTVGIIDHFAGDYSYSGLSGDNIPALSANLNAPKGIAIDASGCIYIADGGDDVIRKIRPVSIAINGSSIVCAGSTTTLTDSVLSGAWSSSSAGIATVDASTGVVSAVSSGTTQITYTVGGSYSIRNITVNGIPSVVAITGASGVCAGSTITLTDATSGGAWNSTTTSVATVGSTGIVAGVSAGTTLISYSVTNGCGTAVATKPVTVNALPVAGTIIGPTSVCAGSTIALTDATPGGIWSSGATSVATVGGTGVVTGLSPGTVTISYSVTNGCGTADAIKPVTINPLPLAGTIGGGSSVCVGSTIALTDAVTGGFWSSTVTSVASVGSTGIVTGISAGTTTLSYSVTNGCGTAAATTSVTVNSLPIAGTISGVSSVCLDSTTTLSDVTTGGIWSSTTGMAAVSSTGDVTGASVGIDTILYMVSNLCGTDSAKKSMTIIDCSLLKVLSTTNTSSAIQVYPNPNDGTFAINLLSDCDENTTVIVTNLVGEKINEITANTNNLVHLKLKVSPGVYFISGTTSHRKYFAKIIIE